uniref:(northern house mosquito) hypothetical protein n=1 Tax=Culex pipiens TaxID=7175 RepID=A0A8D8PB49_CULPI
MTPRVPEIKWYSTWVDSSQSIPVFFTFFQDSMSLVQLKYFERFRTNTSLDEFPNTWLAVEQQVVVHPSLPYIVATHVAKDCPELSAYRSSSSFIYVSCP